MNKKISLLFLSFILMMLVISGCSNQEDNTLQDNQVNTDNSEEELGIIDENPQQAIEEIEDPSLDELDNINLSDW